MKPCLEGGHGDAEGIGCLYIGQLLDVSHCSAHQKIPGLLLTCPVVQAWAGLNPRQQPMPMAFIYPLTCLNTIGQRGLWYTFEKREVALIKGMSLYARSGHQVVTSSA